MRIVHTNMLRGWGGQSNRILVEALGARRRGHEVALVVPHMSVLAQKARDAGIEVFHGYQIKPPIQIWRLLPDMLRLRRDLAAWKPDLIHVHGSPDTWLTMLARSVFDCGDAPVIRTKHHTFPIRNRPGNRWLYGKIDAFISISEYTDAQLAGFAQSASKPRALIHSVPDAANFNSDVPSIRPEVAGVGDDTFVWASTGRLRSEKGFDVLLEAFARVHAARPKSMLVIAGEGSDRPLIEEQARTLGLGDSAFRLLGFRKDVPSVLASVDGFVLASRMEGLGTAILEALSARLPVVATNVGGIPDSVKHERTGLLVPKDDPAALAASMLRFMDDSELRARIARQGHEFVRDCFDEDKLIDKMLLFYQQVLATHRARQEAAAR